jgi:hypothetical protein
MPSHLQKSMLALSFGFLLMIWATQNAHAQSAPPPQCAPRAAVLQALADGYAESRRGIGIAGNSVVMEIFVNAETGTWTITATSPTGAMCLIASGSNFESVTEPAPAKGRPA